MITIGQIKQQILERISTETDATAAYAWSQCYRELSLALSYFPAEGQTFPAKTGERAIAPFAGFRPRSPAEAEKTFPEWFARLDHSEQLVWIYALDEARHPNRRNQGYGSVPIESETSSEITP